MDEEVRELDRIKHQSAATPLSLGRVEKEKWVM